MELPQLVGFAITSRSSLFCKPGLGGNIPKHSATFSFSEVVEAVMHYEMTKAAAERRKLHSMVMACTERLKSLHGGFPSQDAGDSREDGVFRPPD
jgi:hypothetical protein